MLPSTPLTPTRNDTLPALSDTLSPPLTNNEPDDTPIDEPLITSIAPLALLALLALFEEEEEEEEEVDDDVNTRANELLSIVTTPIFSSTDDDPLPPDAIETDLPTSESDPPALTSSDPCDNDCIEIDDPADIRIDPAIPCICVTSPLETDTSPDLAPNPAPNPDEISTEPLLP
jgi:hypothetical protein